jgi:hypothetical protein
MPATRPILRLSHRSRVLIALAPLILGVCKRLGTVGENPHIVDHGCEGTSENVIPSAKRRGICTNSSEVQIPRCARDDSKDKSVERANAHSTDSLDTTNSYSVEARGFEPRSEIRSTTASTCVVHRSVFPSAGRWTADCRMSPLDLGHWRRARQETYPEFAIPAEPPRAGFPTGTRRN